VKRLKDDLVAASEMRKMPGSRGQKAAEDLRQMRKEVQAKLESARAKADAAAKDANAAGKDLSRARKSMKDVESHAQQAAAANTRLEELIKERNQKLQERWEIQKKGDQGLVESDRELAKLQQKIEEASASLLPDWLDAPRGGTPGPGAVGKAIQNTEKLAPELKVSGGIKDVTNPTGQPLGMGNVSPDHIYPVEKIMREPGFLKLTPEQQRAVLELEDNYFVLSEAANSSKGARSMQEWFQTPMGSKIPLEVRQKLLEAEKQAMQSVRDYISGKRRP
jgi:hypothetical protein